MGQPVMCARDQRILFGHGGRHHPDILRRQCQQSVINAVARQDRDGITGLHSLGQQPTGQTTHLSAGLGIGDLAPDVAVAFRQQNRIRRAARPIIQPVARGVRHRPQGTGAAHKKGAIAACFHHSALWKKPGVCGVSHRCFPGVWTRQSCAEGASTCRAPPRRNLTTAGLRGGAGRRSPRRTGVAPLRWASAHRTADPVAPCAVRSVRPVPAYRPAQLCWIVPLTTHRPTGFGAGRVCRRSPTGRNRWLSLGQAHPAHAPRRTEAGDTPVSMNTRQGRATGDLADFPAFRGRLVAFFGHVLASIKPVRRRHD